MLNVSNVSLQYGSRVLFKEVNLSFKRGNCYGVIGANGAGKSTFLKILSGELEPNTGEVSKDPGERIAVLKQDHFAYEQNTVLETVMMGYPELYELGKKRDELYALPEMTEERQRVMVRALRPIDSAVAPVAMFLQQQIKLTCHITVLFFYIERCEIFIFIPFILAIKTWFRCPILGQPVPGDHGSLLVGTMDLRVEFPEPGKRFRGHAEGVQSICRGHPGPSQGRLIGGIDPEPLFPGLF